MHTQDTALQRAVALAEHNQADLTIFHALNLPRLASLPDDYTPGRLKKAIIGDRQNQLEKIAASVPASVDIRSRIIEGAIFPAIIQEVLQNGYDLCGRNQQSARPNIRQYGHAPATQVSLPCLDHEIK